MQPPTRLGLRLPHTVPEYERFVSLCRRAEAVGWDSLWVSEHLAMPVEQAMDYPYTGDHVLKNSHLADWHEAISSLAITAAATQYISVGTCILILPLRHPLLVAKQVATIRALTGRSISLGLGVGWNEAEYAALSANFKSRGAYMDDAIDILHNAWTGQVGPFQGRTIEIPAPIASRPIVPGGVSLLAGGMGKAAIRRARDSCDGWLAIQPSDNIDIEVLRRSTAALRADHRSTPKRCVLRIRGGLPTDWEVVKDAVAIGFSELVLDIDWADPSSLERSLEEVRAELDLPEPSSPNSTHPNPDQAP